MANVLKLGSGSVSDATCRYPVLPSKQLSLLKQFHHSCVSLTGRTSQPAMSICCWQHVGIRLLLTGVNQRPGYKL
jgi:hypothetical protein